jgi:hypothetical protein
VVLIVIAMSTTITDNAPGMARAARGSGVSGRAHNPARMAIAALMVVGGGLLFVSLYRARGRQVPVLIVTRDVRAGEPITDDMLGVADVAATGLATVPASDRAAIVNGDRPMVAVVSLSGGSLLSPGQIGTSPALPADMGLVVVSLPSDAVPAGLRNDIDVQVVTTGKVFNATVFDVRSPSNSSGSSNYAITLLLNAVEAGEVALADDARLVVLPTPIAATLAPTTSTPVASVAKAAAAPPNTSAATVAPTPVAPVTTVAVAAPVPAAPAAPVDLVPESDETP